MTRVGDATASRAARAEQTDVKAAKTASARRDFRAEVTERMIRALEEGTPPWRKPWFSQGAFNGITNRDYHGGNRLYLRMIAQENGWDDPRWFTFNQAKQNEWSVRKGEKGTLVEYWQPPLSEADARAQALREATKNVNVDVESRTAELQHRGWRVFTAVVLNAAQIDAPKIGADKQPVMETITKPSGKEVQRVAMEPLTVARPYVKSAVRAVPQVDEIAAALGVKTVYGQRDGAQYSASRDTVFFPNRNTFRSVEEFAGTYLHELAHSTGHESRLNREGVGKNSAPFGSEVYAKEELRAELASVFLADETGIHPSDYQFEQNRAYVKSWAQQLRESKNEIFAAARDAERISEYVMAAAEERAAFLDADRNEEATLSVQARELLTMSDDGTEHSSEVAAMRREGQSSASVVEVTLEREHRKHREEAALLDRHADERTSDRTPESANHHVEPIEYEWTLVNDGEAARFAQTHSLATEMARLGWRAGGDTSLRGPEGAASPGGLANVETGRINDAVRAEVRSVLSVVDASRVGRGEVEALARYVESQPERRAVSGWSDIALDETVASGNGKWSVTFDRVTDESAKEGDVSESGYVVKDVSMREALAAFTKHDTVKDMLVFGTSWDVIENNDRWFTGYLAPGEATTEMAEEGYTETRSLHLPDDLSSSSRSRLARFLGVHGAEQESVRRRQASQGENVNERALPARGVESMTLRELAKASPDTRIVVTFESESAPGREVEVVLTASHYVNPNASLRIFAQEGTTPAGLGWPVPWWYQHEGKQWRLADEPANRHAVAEVPTRGELAKNAACVLESTNYEEYIFNGRTYAAGYNAPTTGYDGGWTVWEKTNGATMPTVAATSAAPTRETTQRRDVPEQPLRGRDATGTLRYLMPRDVYAEWAPIIEGVVERYYDKPQTSQTLRTAARDMYDATLRLPNLDVDDAITLSQDLTNDVLRADIETFKDAKAVALATTRRVLTLNAEGAAVEVARARGPVRGIVAALTIENAWRETFESGDGISYRAGTPRAVSDAETEAFMGEVKLALGRVQDADLRDAAMTVIRRAVAEPSRDGTINRDVALSRIDLVCEAVTEHANELKASENVVTALSERIGAADALQDVAYEVWYYEAGTDEYIGCYAKQFDTIAEAEASVGEHKLTTGTSIDYRITECAKLHDEFANNREVANDGANRRQVPEGLKDSPLVLTNARGRVVFSAERLGNGTYSYDIESGGGTGVSREQLFESAAYTLSDHRSAKASGELAGEFDAFSFSDALGVVKEAARANRRESAVTEEPFAKVPREMLSRAVPIQNALLGATSWQDLHARLAAQGVSIQLYINERDATHRGYVIVDDASDRYCAAYRFGEGCSESGVRSRIGDFDPNFPLKVHETKPRTQVSEEKHEAVRPEGLNGVPEREMQAEREAKGRKRVPLHERGVAYERANAARLGLSTTRIESGADTPLSESAAVKSLLGDPGKKLWQHVVEQRETYRAINKAIEHFEVAAHAGGVQTYYHPKSETVAFVDRGKAIELPMFEQPIGEREITAEERKAVSGAVAAASRKWNNEITLASNDPRFLRMAVEEAVLLGVSVKNPELQNLQAQLIEQKAKQIETKIASGELPRNFGDAVRDAFGLKREAVEATNKRLEPDALARYIDKLGAKEIGDGRYAFYNDGHFRRYDKNAGFYNAYEDGRWHTFGSASMERISENTEALKLEGQAVMPAWWTPEQQYALRNINTGEIVPDGVMRGSPLAYQGVTVNLETGKLIGADLTNIPNEAIYGRVGRHEGEDVNGRETKAVKLTLHGERETVSVSGEYRGLSRDGNIAVVATEDGHEGFKDVAAFAKVQRGDDVQVRQDDGQTTVATLDEVAQASEAASVVATPDAGVEL